MHRFLWIITAIAITAIAVVHCYRSAFDHDEIEHLHASWLISQGDLPFVTFLEQHHPTIWYAAAPIIRDARDPRMTVFWARLADLAGLAAFIYIFILLARRIAPDAPHLWLALLLIASFTFMRNMIEFRPDPWMNIFIYAGLLAWIAYLQDGKMRQAILSGISFGIAIAILQKALVILMLLGGSSLLLIIINWRNRGRMIDIAKGQVILLLCAIVPVAILFAAMDRLGIFSEFLFWNYTFNKSFYLDVQIPDHFSAFVTIGRSFAHNAMIWIAGLAGVAMIIAKMMRGWIARDRARESWIVVLTIIIGYSVFLLRSRFPFDQYFIVLMPLLALASSELFLSACCGRRRLLLRTLSIAMIIELCAIMLLYKSNAESRDVQNYLLDNTLPTDRIFAPPPSHPIFRRDGAYFWYNAEMIGGVAERAPKSDEIARAMEVEQTLWQSDPAKYVAIDRERETFHPYRWLEHLSLYATNLDNHLGLDIYTKR